MKKFEGKNTEREGKKVIENIGKNKNKIK